MRQCEAAELIGVQRREQRQAEASSRVSIPSIILQSVIRSDSESRDKETRVSLFLSLSSRRRALSLSLSLQEEEEEEVKEEEEYSFVCGGAFVSSFETHPPSLSLSLSSGAGGGGSGAGSRARWIDARHDAAFRARAPSRERERESFSHRGRRGEGSLYHERGKRANKSPRT